MKQRLEPIKLKILELLREIWTNYPIKNIEHLIIQIYWFQTKSLYRFILVKPNGKLFILNIRGIKHKIFTDNNYDKNSIFQTFVEPTSTIIL